MEQGQFVVRGAGLAVVPLDSQGQDQVLAYLWMTPDLVESVIPGLEFLLTLFADYGHLHDGFPL